MRILYFRLGIILLCRDHTTGSITWRKETNQFAFDMKPNRYAAEQKCCSKYLGFLKHVSIEPTMWFYMMAFMITTVVEQSLFLYKACHVNHGYSTEVCMSMKDNETIMAEVQITASMFHQWNNIAGHVVPIVLAFFFGNWSDRRGRKLPLILGLIGKFVYSFMIVVNTLMDTWDVNMIIYTASLPMGILGGDVAIFGCCFAYISDISSVQQRTLRITILDVVYLSTIPTGVALGSYLYTSVLNSSYTAMFIINTSLLGISILYSLIRLEWQTTAKQESLNGVNILVDFFDKKHVAETMKTLTKRRQGYIRLHIWILLMAMTLYTFHRDEKNMTFLYTQLIFKWDVAEYSTFSTFKSALFVLVLLVGVPTMSKLLKMKDTSIIMISAAANATGKVVFALAILPTLFYVGAAVSTLGPMIPPVLRSMTSKLLPADERGKVFAILAVCDNAVPLFSGILYSQIYNATINTLPSAIFWVTFASQILVLLLILVVHFTPTIGEQSSAVSTANDLLSESANTEETNRTNGSIDSQVNG